MNRSASRALVTTVDRLARRLERVGEQAWIRDNVHRFCFGNRAFAGGLRLSPADLENRPDDDLFSPDESSDYRWSDRCCRRAETPVYFEEFSDSGRLVDTLKFPLVLPSGAVVGVAGIACPFPGLSLPGDPPNWLRRIKRHLAASFASPPGIGRLARRIGTHPDYLARSFKRRYGIGIHDYVRALRVQWCTWSLFENPDRSLSELALTAGFADQSHLTREFRRSRGITPGRLRERLREAAGKPGPVQLAPDPSSGPDGRQAPERFRSEGRRF